MEIIYSIVNSLIVAATACPWWIWAIWWMTVIGEVRKTEDIIGFWPKLGSTIWYGLLGAGCLTLAIAVGRWAMPPTEWHTLANRIGSLMGTWVDAQFETHFWRSLLVAICLTPVAVVIWLVTLASLIADFLGIREKTIQAPDPSGVHGTARIATDEDLAAAGLTGGKWGEGIRLGYDGAGKPMRYLEGQSVILVGPSGAGKNTDFLTYLMAEAGNKSMLVLDPAGQITPLSIEEARKRGPTVVITLYKELLPPGVADLLGPTDGFNVMAWLDPMAETFQKQCDSIGENLGSPDRSGESAEAGHFTVGAQSVISGVVMGLKLYYPPEKANLAEVCDIICGGDRIFEFTQEMVKRGDPHVLNRLSFLTAANAKQSKSVADILQTARLKLKFISDPAMHAVLQTSNWRWSDLKHGRRPTTIFVCVAEAMMSHCAPILGLLLTSATEELLATPKGKHDVIVVVDEFPLLPKSTVPTFTQLFSVGRKHGASGYIRAQNYGQIEDLAGHLGAESLTSGAGIQIYLPPRDDKTADRISKLTGRRTVVTQSTSYSQRVPGGEWTPGLNFPEHGQPVFDSHQVKGLGRHHFLMFAFGLVNDVIIGARRPYWLDEDVRKRCGRDPYHLDGNANSPSGDGNGGRKKKSFWRWLWEV